MDRDPSNPDWAAQNRTWNVECWLCGAQLGSNKDECKKIGTSKKTRFPPCIWAHTDDRIVQKCVKIAKEKREQEAAEQLELQETKRKLESGVINFNEPGVDAGAEVRGQSQVNEPRVDDGEEVQVQVQPQVTLQQVQQHCADLRVIEQKSLAAAGMAPASPASLEPPKAGASKRRSKAGSSAAAKKAKTDDDDDKGRTKWNTTNRTILWRCIQKYDPFSAADKTSVWDTIAEQMHESTERLKDDEDDFQVYSNGKSLQVYFKRAKDLFKEKDEEGHSGHAGPKELSEQKKEERQQLAACIEMERCAKESIERKREAKTGYDDLRKGEVNDMIIALARDHENIKSKAVTVLASKLRQAKMRKLSYEQTNKDGKYTYGAEDMANFEYWRKMKAIDPELPEDPTEGMCTVEKAGGKMAAAITNLTETLAASAKHVQPMNPGEFFTAFFEAKEAKSQRHETAGTLTLDQKLKRVDDDVAKKVISPAKGEEVRNKIIDAHYFV